MAEPNKPHKPDDPKGKKPSSEPLLNLEIPEHLHLAPDAAEPVPEVVEEVPVEEVAEVHPVQEAEVHDVEEVMDVDEEPPIVEAAPASDVAKVELVEDVVDIVEPASDIAKVEPVEEVEEIVEAAPASDVAKVDLVEEVEEEIADAVPASDVAKVEMVEEVEEPEAAPPPSKAPKTRVGGKGSMPTMMAQPEDGGEAVPEPEKSAAPPAPGDETEEIVEISGVDEDVMEAVEASDPRLGPGGPAEAKSKKSLPEDTAEVAFPEEEAAEVPAGAETGSSSQRIADMLLASSDELVEKQAADAANEPIEEAAADKAQAPAAGDKTTELEAPSEELGPTDHTAPTDVVVEYEEKLVEGESEVDLEKRPSAKAQKMPLDESDVNLEDVLSDSAESSAVDLGSSDERPALPVSPPPAKRRAATEETAGASEDVFEEVTEDALLDSGKIVAGEKSDSEVLVTPKNKFVSAVDEDELATVQEEGSGDLLAASKGKKPVADETAEAVDEDGVAAKTKQKIAEDEEVIEGLEEEPVAPKSKRRVEEDEELVGAGARRGGRGPFLPFLLGGFLAFVLVGGGSAAAWYFGALPESPNAAKKPAPKQGPPVTIASDAQKARELIDQGKYKEALEIVQKAEEGPEAAARGLAEFKKYEAQLGEDKLPSLKDAAEALKLLEKGGATSVVADIKNRIDLGVKWERMVAAEDEARKAKDQVAKEKDKLADEKKALDMVLTETKSDLQKALDTIGTAAKVLAKATTIDPKQPPDAQLLKGLTDLVTAKANADAKLKGIDAALAKAGFKAGGAKAVQDLAAARDKLAMEENRLNTAIDGALKELKEGSYLSNDPDRMKQLVEGTRKARLAGQSPLGSSLNQIAGSFGGMSKMPGDWFKKAFDTTKLSAELAAAKAQNAFSETPEHRLDTLLALLGDPAFKDAKELAAIGNYLDWLRSKEAKTNAETRAKALYAQALIRRNQDNFAGARQALTQTLQEAKTLKGGAPLTAAATQSLKELTDPTAYYLPRAERHLADGRLKVALDELNTGLKVLPGHPELLMKRAQVLFDAARSQGKIDDATQKLIRDDAQAAAKNAKLAAESYFLVGRLEEQNGAWLKAEENYRQAVKLAGAGDQGDRYRAALARLLQRDRPAGAAPAEEAPKAGGLEEETETVDVLGNLALTAVLFVDQGDDAEDLAAKKRLQESMSLAKELIKSSNVKTRGEGYMLLGAAQGREGKKTEGLKNFVKGLKLAYPDWATEELDKIVSTHPAFQQPDVAVQALPLVAERHFGKGLDYFWSKKYADAETEFAKAVVFFDQDARYRYFLGLSRYLQGTKDKKNLAEFDFEQGIRLEMARKPSTRDINASLERIQGELRRILNSYRDRPAGPS
jgi:hypothetical protein